MVAEMSDIIADPESSDDERGIAADAITEALAPALMADVVGKYSQFIQRSSGDESTAKVQSEEKQFAENVRRLMDEKGWNQETLADKIGISQPAISNMLNRHCRPQNRTILRLAEAFEVSPDTVWPDFSSRQTS
jgi:lambda repressor-like predicted transcriptional regulator